MTSFGFGSQTQTPAFGGFSFGAQTSTTSTPSFAATSFTNPTTTAPNLTFGAPTTTTATGLFSGSTGFNPPTTSLFPAAGQTTTTTTASTGFSFGGFGVPSTNTGIGFGSTAPATTTVSTVGLGGVDLQASGINGVNASGKKDKAVKETFLPQELLATVEAHKKYVKEQKAIREEMSRVTSKNISKVQSQVGTLRQQLSCVSNGVQRNAIAIAKLKQESAEELMNARVIQRTKETPPSLQYENTAPAAYFHNLANSFENQMQLYRQQIEQLQRHLLSLSQPSTMTPNELTVVMRRLHDAFVTLAAQLQTVHQQVEAQKEQFLSLKRLSESDVSRLFHSQKISSGMVAYNEKPKVSAQVGPGPVKTLSPSSTLTAVSDLRVQNRSLQDVNANLSKLNMSGLGTSLSTSNLLGSTMGYGSGFGGSGNTSFKPLGK